MSRRFLIVLCAFGVVAGYGSEFHRLRMHQRWARRAAAETQNGAPGSPPVSMGPCWEHRW